MGDRLINVILARATVSYIAGPPLQIGGRVVERLPDFCSKLLFVPLGSHAESDRGQLINRRVNGNRCRQN